MTSDFIRAELSALYPDASEIVELPKMYVMPEHYCTYDHDLHKTDMHIVHIDDHYLCTAGQCDVCKRVVYFE